MFQPIDRLTKFVKNMMYCVFQPIDKVAEFVKDMQTKELNKDDLSTVAHLAYLESQPGTTS